MANDTLAIHSFSDIESIYAAIWFCDLRGFTRFSDRESREDVIDTLNDWFDCIADPIEEQGGEILKFMGDGLLAIFAADGDPAAACDRALDAAQAAASAVDTFNDIRCFNKQPLLAYGLALHLGEVGFGNIGSRRRLDFTVIGPAVNHASRLQELTDELSGTGAAHLRLDPAVAARLTYILREVRCCIEAEILERLDDRLSEATERALERASERAVPRHPPA